MRPNTVPHARPGSGWRRSAGSIIGTLSGLVMLAVLSGCASSASTAGQNGESGRAAASGSGTSASGQPAAISVVTSTNVWGDVAATIGGDLVHVDAFISDPAQDPHSFEASPRAQLSLSRAALVIENGGGYDDFMDTMLDAVGSKPPVINAVDVSGKTAAAGGELNEHVWYDFPTVGKVASEVAAKLSAIDPSASARFTANLATFQRALDGLTADVATIKAAHAGAPVAITEPVPLYLLEAAGLENLTPGEFSEAVEEGSDVPARTLAETLALFADKRVKLLAYNEQTAGPETEQMLKAARDNDIPTVPVTETMPPGDSYVGWMQSNVDAIGDALGG